MTLRQHSDIIIVQSICFQILYNQSLDIVLIHLCWVQQCIQCMKQCMHYNHVTMLDTSPIRSGPIAWATLDGYSCGRCWGSTTSPFFFRLILPYNMSSINALAWRTIFSPQFPPQRQRMQIRGTQKPQARPNWWISMFIMSLSTAPLIAWV